MRPGWVTRQIANFVMQFCNDLAWIGIGDREMLSPGGWKNPANPGAMILRQGGGGYLAINDPTLKGGFVWAPKTGGEKELWMPPAQGDYRDVFEIFAKRYLGAAGLTGADVQIDHVFPKKAAILDSLAFVRMLAIPPESNMAAGRTVERAMAARATVSPRGKLVRLATYYSVGKATGFTGYAALPDSTSAQGNTAIVNALFKYLRNFGLPGEVLTALDARLTSETLVRHR
jgi:hypothetical protein